MTGDTKRNVPHSMFQRLLNLARTQTEDMNLLLTRYAMERYLYRLSISLYADRFIMKGASLFLVWQGRNYRVTKDTDMLVTGPSDKNRLERVFSELCSLDSSGDDGMRFIPESVRATDIQEGQAYEGVRITLSAELYRAKISLQFDIGFGDVVTPAVEWIIYPVLLDGPAPKLQAYPRYTVVSEKLEAMVRLGIANSRMKDFYDIMMLSRLFEFDGEILCKAIRNTFTRRRTPLPEGIPMALTEMFFLDGQKQMQWKAFIRKTKPADSTGQLEDTVIELRRFILPVLEHLKNVRPLDIVWRPDDGWT